MRPFLVAVALVVGTAFAEAPAPHIAEATRVALHQIGAQAVDIQEVARRITATAARTKVAGRPVALGALEADVHQLAQDLRDLDKLLNQLDRSMDPH